MAEKLPVNLHQAGFLELPATVAHSLKAGGLRGPHRDPFDRMLIAQSFLSGFPVVTFDPVFRDYGVRTVW